MTGYSDWYVIVNVAYNVLIIWPIIQDYFISTIKYSGSDICFAVVKHEITIFFYSLCIQIEIIHTFTAKSGLVFYHKKFFTYPILLQVLNSCCCMEM